MTRFEKIKGMNNSIDMAEYLIKSLTNVPVPLCTCNECDGKLMQWLESEVAEDDE